MGVRLVIHNFEVDEMDYTGTHNHDDLLHRDWVDQHPIYAITGLQEVLNTIEINLINITNRINTLSDNTGGTVKDHAENFEIIKCTQLPTENIKTMTIYFLQIDPEQDDLYEEYMYIDGQWEKIGNTRIDLSDYVTKTMLQSAVDTINNTITTKETAINESISDLEAKHDQDVQDINDEIDQLEQNINNELDQLGQDIDNINTNISNSHTHTNKSVLDNLTQSVIDNSHTHTNKSVLDKFSTDNDGKLLYNNNELIETFTESDVTKLIHYLWPSEYKTNFIMADNTYIVTQDNKIFVAKEGDS